MATFQEIRDMLNILGAAFPASHVSEQTAAVYAVALQDLSVEQLRQATAWLIGNHESNFLPAVATIRRAAIEGGRERLPTITEALAEMKEQISKVGVHGAPHFSHPAIAAAVKATGWRELCMSEKPEVVNGQFRRLYESYSERWESDRRSLPQDGRVVQALGAIADKMRGRALPKPKSN